MLLSNGAGAERSGFGRRADRAALATAWQGRGLAFFNFSEVVADDMHRSRGGSFLHPIPACGMARFREKVPHEVWVNPKIHPSLTEKPCHDK